MPSCPVVELPHCCEVVDEVGPHITVESAPEPTRGGRLLGGGRQIREDTLEVDEGQGAGDVRDSGGGEELRWGLEAVVDLDVIEEVDVPAGVPGDGPVEQCDQVRAGRRCAAVPEEAPDRPVRVEAVVRGRIPIRRRPPANPPPLRGTAPSTQG